MKDELETVPNTDGIEREEDKHPSRIKKPQSIGWWLIGFLILLGVALLTGIAIKYRTLETFPPWVSFLSASLLNLLLLAVLIAQAYIYHKQRDAMIQQLEITRGQLTAMKDSLIETQRIAEQNEQAIRVAEQGVDIAEQTAIYAQRAYLSAKVENVYDGFLFYLKIENSGNTPANEITVSYSSGFSEAEPDGLDTDFTGQRHIGLIAPKGHHLHRAPYIEIPPQEDKARYNAGEWKFYCWGLISYLDIFEKGRRTWFSFYVSPINMQGLKAYPCSRGNRAD